MNSLIECSLCMETIFMLITYVWTMNYVQGEYSTDCIAWFSHITDVYYYLYNINHYLISFLILSYNISVKNKSKMTKSGGGGEMRCGPSFLKEKHLANMLTRKVKLEMVFKTEILVKDRFSIETNYRKEIENISKPKREGHTFENQHCGHYPPTLCYSFSNQIFTHKYQSTCNR